MMSKHIGSRSPTQCKSHHQQMIKQFKNVDTVIKELERAHAERKQSISETAEAKLEPIDAIGEVDY